MHDYLRSMRSSPTIRLLSSPNILARRDTDDGASWHPASGGGPSTLSTSQLALVDGRSVYLDFFGMVMWDLVPTNPDEIRQIEVIRGPASAIWGANAMTGVVNVITRTPRELARSGKGTQLTIGGGSFNR